jgi:hypothetical protein
VTGKEKGNAAATAECPAADIMLPLRPAVVPDQFFVPTFYYLGAITRKIKDTGTYAPK